MKKLIIYFILLSSSAYAQVTKPANAVAVGNSFVRDPATGKFYQYMGSAFLPNAYYEVTPINAPNFTGAPTISGALVLSANNSVTITNKTFAAGNTWSGDIIGLAYGGTGLSSIGTPSQQLRVNGAGTGLEYFTPTSGGVTSVGISGSDFSISGSPVTTSGNIGLALATVNGNVGSFGSATQVPTFTVNGKGLITAASNTNIQIAQSQVTNLASTLATKANDNNVVHLTGDENITGYKYFDVTAIINSDLQINGGAKIRMTGTSYQDWEDPSTVYRIRVRPAENLTNNYDVRYPIKSGTNYIYAYTSDIPFLLNYTASGDGSTTAIVVPHGLSGITSASPVIVQAKNAASAGLTYVTIDSANVTINYSVAPASGTSNLSYSIQIKP